MYSHQCTILIVDDDAGNRLYLKFILKNVTANLPEAVNGYEALKLIESGFPLDLVLMDINMPVMSGLKALEAIRKIKPNLPIIAVTAHVATYGKQSLFDYGFNEVIGKPFLSEDILEMVKHFI
ncbi:MAG: response regulator [Bacteroidota bacterium]|jgi:two-component system, cell cycle response regulator DivK